MTSMIFDDTICELGEGPLWHPERQQLFWFDITGQKLLTQSDGETQIWDFDEMVSAAGWVDKDHLLIASETALLLFSIETGDTEYVTSLESDNPVTRSNDGRADPFGGFWIGTMGKAAEKNAGAIYRYYRGELRKLYPNVTIPNAICFSPDGGFGYYTDTAKGLVMRQRLDAQDGWPEGKPEMHIDLRGHDWGVDGAVIDADGNFWNAQWGGWRIAAYTPDGTFLREIAFDAAHTSCPAFGGPDLTTLYCTSARERVSPENWERGENHGKTFVIKGVAKGQAEHRVIL